MSAVTSQNINSSKFRLFHVNVVTVTAAAVSCQLVASSAAAEEGAVRIAAVVHTHAFPLTLVDV